MFSNNLEIKLKTYRTENITILLSNRDIHFTEKIINQNIQIQNLIFKITINNLDKIDSVIKSKYIPKYVKSDNSRIEYLNFSFDDKEVIITNLNKDNLYQILIELIEKIPISLTQAEIPHKSSNTLILNTQFGIITPERIIELNKSRFAKKIICASEKDAIREVENQIGLQELDEILTLKEIKSMTLENRNFKGIDRFINSNTKFSKKMTEQRKKKVLYSTEAKLFFEEKMMKNNVHLANTDKNPFMKNEWYMGPIYSYDKNYKKFI
jgi:hypothetical protein